MKQLLAALLFALAFVPATTVRAEAATEYDMVFPIIGDVEFDNTWGNPRSGGRRHIGTDILADKLMPVVAVSDGKIDWIHDGTRKTCCALGIEHDDGWVSYYIHLNNDTPGTDDADGWGFAPGIEKGTRVVAGQLIGWVGDSGNAEGTVPHIHFELHRPDGTPINPFYALEAADEAETFYVQGESQLAVADEISQTLGGAIPVLSLSATPADSRSTRIATVRNVPEMMLVITRQPGAAEVLEPVFSPDLELVEFTLIESYESIQRRLGINPPS